MNSYSGQIEIPASKSQTIRAILIALFSNSESRIRHPLYSEDTLSAISLIEKMGAIVRKEENGDLLIDSRFAFIDLDSDEIDCGNSGTTTYLALPMLSSLPFSVTLKGDSSLSKRPVKPLLDSLEDLGVETMSNEGFLPITVRGPMEGGNTEIECKTSQYLSGLLLGCPLALGDSHIHSTLLNEKPYVRMTLKWLDKQGIRYEASPDLLDIFIPGGQSYKEEDEYIEGDFSSASFFFALATIGPYSITVTGLDRNSEQGDKAMLDILEKMGCVVDWDGMSVTVTGPEKLKGGEFDLSSIPDTLPSLSIVASFASEKVVLGNVEQARIKETDRIAVLKENLTLLGVNVEDTQDSLIIYPSNNIHGGCVKGYKDHRIIMAFSIMATKIENITLDDSSAAAVTFPSFFDKLNSLKENAK